MIDLCRSGLVRFADQVFGQEGLMPVAPVGTGDRAKERRTQGGDRHDKKGHPLQIEPAPRARSTLGLAERYSFFQGHSAAASSSPAKNISD